MSDIDKLREFVRLAGSATAVEKLALDLAEENAELKDEIRRHEKVFQFSAERIAALKRELMSLKAAYYRANSRRWKLEEDALLTAEEQE